MIIGTTLFKMGGNAYYTPEFPRGGLAATLAFEVINLEGSPTVSATFQNRALDTPSWSDNGVASLTTTGVTTLEVTDVQEMCRIKFTFAAGDQSTDGIHFFLPAPAWRPFS